MGLVPENILYALVDDPTVDLTTIHEAISKYFTSAVPEHKRGALESQLANSTLIDRTIRQLLHEGDFVGALALWIQGLEYVKRYPEAFEDKMSNETANDGAVTENAYNKFPSSRETQFAIIGLVSYFLSLKQDAESELDTESVELIIGGLKGRERPNFHQVEFLLNRLQISEENLRFVIKQWHKLSKLRLVDHNELQT
ncbi:unnamed protein product [Ambrosiozyma monospora]|uniref:Unnamed protein product n=1 Tax=Ambrosiozyma monospora TaxID=43982 RepID=A0ACB5T4S2_AMBMO|nr:unnamed protein product [Ambrosiozyma monospora]